MGDSKFIEKVDKNVQDKITQLGCWVTEKIFKNSLDKYCSRMEKYIKNDPLYYNLTKDLWASMSTWQKREYNEAQYKNHVFANGIVALFVLLAVSVFVLKTIY